MMDIGDVSDLFKRTKWTPEEMESAVEHATANHASYMYQKQHRKVADFWCLVGQSVGHSGEECERLFKNLTAEYRRVKQFLSMPGTDKSTPPALRHSASLFVVFENFYHVFRNETNVIPAILTTESPFTFVQTPALSSSSLSSLRVMSSPTTDEAMDSEKLAIGVDPSESEKETIVFVGNDSKKVVVKSARRPQQLTNEDYMRQMLNIENRKLVIKNRRLQLKISKLRVSRRKVEALEKICAEMETVRTMYAMANGMEIVTSPSVSQQRHPVNSRLISSTSTAREQGT